ncbi:MAG: hypothetical protein P8099_13365 [Gemmatimonadota bacterium]
MSGGETGWWVGRVGSHDAAVCGVRVRAAPVATHQSGQETLLMDEILPQIFAFILAGVILGVPVLALSLRFALKPLVESYTRLKEAQQSGSSKDLPVVVQQLAMLERRMQAIEEHMDRLDEVAEFHRELEKGKG